MRIIISTVIGLGLVGLGCSGQSELPPSSTDAALAQEASPREAAASADAWVDASTTATTSFEASVAMIDATSDAATSEAAPLSEPVEAAVDAMTGDASTIVDAGLPCCSFFVYYDHCIICLADIQNTCCTGTPLTCGPCPEAGALDGGSSADAAHDAATLDAAHDAPFEVGVVDAGVDARD
jgi:hypothetical protein